MHQDKNYDENFTRHETMSDDKTDWYEVTKKEFDLYGLVKEESDFISRRMPDDVAKDVNDGVRTMCRYGAGARLLFSTDSSFVSLRVEYGPGMLPTVCNHIVVYGFDLYKSDEKGEETFVATYRPPADFNKENCDYTAQTRNNGVLTQYTLNFPHFCAIKKLYIGIAKGKKLGHGKKYKNDGKPVVFYGSSITHGAAAGRPGNTYENFISQKYNLDYVNLGFSGCARGEEAMAKYIASLDMSVFVCDYDHNAYTLELLRDTYYPLYKVVREKHPDIPYIIVSRPDRRTNPYQSDVERFNIIYGCYERAKSEGDNNVYFIPGDSLFEGEFVNSCTSDGCHPNDIGFMRMAQVIGKLVNSVLK